MPDSLLDPMKREIEWSLLKHAVQTALFCQYGECARILDTRRAILVQVKGEGSMVICNQCYHTVEGTILELYKDAEITDGRLLHRTM